MKNSSANADQALFFQLWYIAGTEWERGGRYGGRELGSSGISKCISLLCSLLMYLCLYFTNKRGRGGGKGGGRGRLGARKMHFNVMHLSVNRINCRAAQFLKKLSSLSTPHFLGSEAEDFHIQLAYLELPISWTFNFQWLNRPWPIPGCSAYW